MKPTYFSLLCIIMIACNEPEFGSGFIDPKLKPYLNSFLEEAQSRGFNIDASKLTLRFGTYPGADAAANMRTYEILVDSNSYDWKSGILREQLLYHEFGHLFLKRKHDDSRIGRYPKSIMAAEDDPYYECRSCRNRRTYYINELFNPNEKRPEWCYE
jgi:hypothetical protein